MNPVTLLLVLKLKSPSGPPSPPESISFDIAGAGVISLSWPLSLSFLNITLTYELHTLKDGKLLGVIPVNETVYEYSFKDRECETYKFAVYSLNEAGISANSTEIFVAVPNGEQHLMSYFLFSTFSLKNMLW